MAHDSRLLAEDRIAALAATIPAWVKNLARPKTPMLVPEFGPLKGIRVISSGVFIAQPWAGTKMAHFGAEVIHVERAAGDTHRLTAPHLKRGKRSHSCDWANEGSNRLSFGLDLKDTKGIELLMALWKISDVWMEASPPGTCERMGIPPELALAVNPSLVVLRTSTYGQYGDDAMLGRPGYDLLAQAYGGMMAVTGDPSGPPQRAKVFTGDYLTALHGWAATMMALWEVRNTGRGQVIDMAQYEAVFCTQGFQMPLLTGEGKVATYTGNKAPGFQPYDTFMCKDGWVAIGALGNIMFPRVAKVLGLDTDEYCYENCSKDEQAVNSKIGLELDRRLREFCKTRTRLEVEKIFNDAMVGCSRIMNSKDMLNEKHYHERESHVPVVDRQSGVPIRVAGIVPKMSLTPGQVWRGAPALGEDTTNVMSRLLGFDDKTIAAYYERKTIHRTEPCEEAVVEPIVV